MKILTECNAGTNNKEDVFVSISPCDGENIIEIHSPIAALFGNSMREAAETLLEKYEIENCHICIFDNNALDYTLKSRIEAAIRKGINDCR